MATYECKELININFNEMKRILEKSRYENSSKN